MTWLDLTWTFVLTWLDLTCLRFWNDLTWLDLTWTFWEGWLDLTWLEWELEMTWLDLTWLEKQWLANSSDSNTWTYNWVLRLQERYSFLAYFSLFSILSIFQASSQQNLSELKPSIKYESHFYWLSNFNKFNSPTPIQFFQSQWKVTSTQVLDLAIIPDCYSKMLLE